MGMMTCGMLCVMRRERRGVLHLDNYSPPKANGLGRKEERKRKRKEKGRKKKRERKEKENQQFFDLRTGELQE